MPAWHYKSADILLSLYFVSFLLDINECSSEPCQNYGTCLDSVNDYKCFCAPGYTGLDCELGKLHGARPIFLK